MSLRGIFPNSPTLDHAGPLARTARDCGIMLQAMAGYDPADAGSKDRETPDFCALIGAGVEGMRFGVCEDLYLPENDASVQKGFENAIETMKALGGAVVHVRYPNAERMRDVRRIIASAELAAVHRERLATHPEKIRRRRPRAPGNFEPRDAGRIHARYEREAHAHPRDGEGVR